MKHILSHTFVLTVVTLSAMAAMTTAVAAQEADTIIAMDTLLAPWLPTIVSIAVAVLTALGAWLSVWIKRKTGLEIEFLHRDTFQTAVNNAAGYILAQAGRVHVDARHPMLKEAVLLVNQGARDAVGYFGVSDDQIAKKIISKLGLNQEPVDNTVKVVEPDDPRNS